MSDLLTYNGNSNLKRKGQDLEWDLEMVKEYKKCSNDPIYFIRNYVKIVHVDHGLVPFNLYDYQEDMVNSMINNRNTIITTARQVGKSTTTVAFILWYILFNDDKTVALLANKGDTAREILSRVKLAFEHLPKWLQHGVVEWNKGSIELENNSKILAGATSGSAIRGYSINLLFIDEAAHIENWNEFFTSVFPTISSGKTTKVVLVSTPNGLNDFYKIWVNALEGRNQYNPIFVPWHQVPGRDEAWKEETLSGMNYDYEKFDQEYNVEFQGSSGTLISGAKLKQLVHQTPLHEKDGLAIYKQHEEGRTYSLVADVSRGKGMDYSAFHVIDITKMPYQQVAVFRDNITAPRDYAAIIYGIAKTYNNAQVLVEINDIGEVIPDILHEEYEYENILYSENRGRNGKSITLSWKSNIDKGVRTTKAVKATGCSILKLLVEQDQLIINDHETISELSTFSKKGVSYEAEPGAHDDLAMGLVLFAWLSSQAYFKDLTDINTMSLLREKSEEQMMEDLIPFGFISENGNEPTVNQVVGVRGNSTDWLLGTDEW
jgi:hypothetical protein